MNARDEMAALLATTFVESPPPRVMHEVEDTVNLFLDAIAGFATDPETAPVVFRWLVEAGVLVETCAECGMNREHHDDTDIGQFHESGNAAYAPLLYVREV